jgi:hypothetical protein
VNNFGGNLTMYPQENSCTLIRVNIGYFKIYGTFKANVVINLADPLKGVAPQSDEDQKRKNANKAASG